MLLVDERVLERIITKGQTSKITHFELHNFAQFKYERFDFDEDGILVLKAPNSTGKSMVLRGLRSLLTAEWVSNSKVKKLIRYNETEARVNVFFDDGVEIEYRMMLSSLASRARFKNGYHLYYHQKGKRIEIYNTLQNDRYITVKEVPLPIKRYLNLAEMGGKYLNVMKNSEGLMVFDQKPKELSKTLAKVADLETAEKVISEMKKDNKSTLDELRAEDIRIKLFSDEIEERKHLTKEVMGILYDNDRELDSLNSSKGTSLSLSEDISSVLNLEFYPTIDSIDEGILSNVVSLVHDIKSLSSLEQMPKVSSLDYGSLNLAKTLLDGIIDVSEIEFYVDDLEKISTSILQKFVYISNLIKDVQSDRSTLCPTIGSINYKHLNVLKNIEKDLESYTEFTNNLSKGLKELSSLKKDTDNKLKELKELGYPVSVCTACGELTISEEFTSDDMGISVAHTH